MLGEIDALPIEVEASGSVAFSTSLLPTLPTVPGVSQAFSALNSAPSWSVTRMVSVPLPIPFARKTLRGPVHVPTRLGTAASSASSPRQIILRLRSQRVPFSASPHLVPLAATPRENALERTK